MITNVVQRWRDRVGSYRPAGEVIATSAYTVEALADDRTAKDFVLQHHYAGSYPAARFRHGLFWGGLLVGVAVFSHPANNRVLAVFPGDPLESVELGRLVLLDFVPANAETWFLARCFALLRRAGISGVVSFSDPVGRSDAAGRVIFPGHIGTIYQAHNARYLGRTRPETRRLLPDGTILHNRALAKIKSGDQGHRYAAALLERHGASPLAAQAPAAWLQEWVPRLTRPLWHEGNHRYVWGLSPSVQRWLPPGGPYPKFGEARGVLRRPLALPPGNGLESSHASPGL